MPIHKCNRCGVVWDYHTDVEQYCFGCAYLLHRRKTRYRLAAVLALGIAVSYFILT